MEYIHHYKNRIFLGIHKHSYKSYKPFHLHRLFHKRNHSSIHFGIHIDECWSWNNDLPNIWYNESRSRLSSLDIDIEKQQCSILDLRDKQLYMNNHSMLYQ